MVGKNLAPVIIKRKKVIASGGHHGGAWKVAYAAQTVWPVGGHRSQSLHQPFL